MSPHSAIPEPAPRLKKVSGTHRESVVREAFKDLLKGWSRSRDLIFVPEYEIATPAKDRRSVDGAMVNTLRLPFGSALEWIFDQYKEKKPKDPTIREKFNTYRFADYKEKVIDLLMRVTTVSVRTVAIANLMKHAGR